MIGLHALSSLLSTAAVALPTTPPPPMSGAEIAKALERACVLGTVLYVAAHPDDENTHLLSWFVGERGLRAAYVSMTRGGGGQNLIGSEQSELLGLVRTRELLAARAIDGAEQYFTRARDFGYSKTPEETLHIWDREQALADLVYVIRRLRPDVIVTRFPLTGKTHGHHLASAILGAEAFDAAADPQRFPEQLAHVAPWQATRIVENKPHWRIPKDADTSTWLKHDVSGYDALLGRSWGEIAAASRSMHKSQGFGSAPRRGVSEYFVPIKGTPYADDLFSGIDLSWSRVPGGDAVGKHLKKALAALDMRHPERIVPLLVAARDALGAVGDPHWRAVKGAELDRLIVAASGIVLQARADRPAAAPGHPLTLSLEAMARTAPAGGVSLESVQWPWEAGTVQPRVQLAGGAPETLSVELRVPADATYTIPHWLAQPATPGAYVTTDQARIGDADDPAAISVVATLKVGGRAIALTLPVEHLWVDPVMGQRRRDTAIVPGVTATFDRSVVMLPTKQGARQVEVVFEAWADDVRASVRFDGPKGVAVEPTAHEVQLAKAGDRTRLTLSVTPSTDATAGDLAARVTVAGRDASYQALTLDHAHIPRRIVLQPSRLRVVPLGLKTGGRRIAYVIGSGDRVGESLAQVGYQVDSLSAAELLAARADALRHYDAVVIGVRAYNVNPDLVQANDTLMDYVRAGGRVIVQYQTNNRWRRLTGPIGPAPFTISRGRVTDESAEVRLLKPRHPAVRQPNRLTDDDWLGWVQERGLYFAESWDARYTPLLSLNDAGEQPLEGSTLVTVEGKGVFVFTGLSFFRQLPAGVPGAYRLFANLLALEPWR